MNEKEILAKLAEFQAGTLGEEDLQAFEEELRASTSTNVEIKKWQSYFSKLESVTVPEVSGNFLTELKARLTKVQGLSQNRSGKSIWERLFGFRPATETIGLAFTLIFIVGVTFTLWRQEFQPAEYREIEIPQKQTSEEQYLVSGDSVSDSNLDSESVPEKKATREQELALVPTKNKVEGGKVESLSPPKEEVPTKVSKDLKAAVKKSNKVTSTSSITKARKLEPVGKNDLKKPKPMSPTPSATSMPPASLEEAQTSPSNPTEKPSSEIQQKASSGAGSAPQLMAKRSAATAGKMSDEDVFAEADEAMEGQSAANSEIVHLTLSLSLESSEDSLLSRARKLSGNVIQKGANRYLLITSSEKFKALVNLLREYGVLDPSSPAKPEGESISMELILRQK